MCLAMPPPPGGLPIPHIFPRLGIAWVGRHPGSIFPALGRKGLFWHRTPHFRSCSQPLGLAQGHWMLKSSRAWPRSRGLHPRVGVCSLISGKQVVMPT